MPMNQYIMNVKVKKKPKLTSIPIMFTDEDEARVNFPHDDAIVITLKIYSTSINRILINTKSSVDIIFKETLSSLKI